MSDYFLSRYQVSLTQTLPKMYDMIPDDEEEYFNQITINIIRSMQKSNGMTNVTMGLFGSSDSNDKDIFIDLPLHTLSNIFKENVKFFVKEILYTGECNVLPECSILDSSELREKIESNGYDIQFITTKDGKVVWAEKGNITEINNSIYNTFKLHNFNYKSRGELKNCPVNIELAQDIAIKAMKCVRALLTSISRTSYREDAKKLLKNYSFSDRIQWILFTIVDDGFLINIDDFNKNITKKDILKDIAFSFIQLKAMVDNTEIPYNKHDAIMMCPEYYKFIIKENVNFEEIDRLNTLIIHCLDACIDLTKSDNDGILQFYNDEFSYNVKFEEIFYEKEK